jgi:SAM-dependent methyltransferase
VNKSLYRRLKDIWQILPPSWNERIKQGLLTRRILQMIAGATVKSASHQEIYDQRYYARIDAAATTSKGPMAATIARLFEPASVIDVGCGSGAFLVQLKQRGIQVKGLEYSDAGIALCLEKGIPVEKFDLESSVATEGNFDLTTSFEVGEHVPGSLADNYVRVISQFSPVVIMSAATIGQGGSDHVNEQPHEYWIEKMQGRGFDHDGQTSNQVRLEWAEKGVASWYTNNAMIFRRRATQ